ncbi:MAG: DUF6328 family protein [Actinomycetota bacterium]
MPEGEKDRLNRKLIELLNELRIVLPGVQVLFAFLLALPFTGRFDEITVTQRGLYFGSFFCAAVASALLIAPSAYHRLRWRVREEEGLEAKVRLLVTAGFLAIGGIVFLGFAVAGVVYLVTDLLFGARLAVALTSVIASIFVLLWFALPLADRAREARASPRRGRVRKG